MNVSVVERVHLNLKKLELFHIDEIVDETLESLAQQGKSYMEIIDELTNAEVECRKERSIKTRLKLAKLPYIKTLDTFDMEFHSGLNIGKVRELFSLQFAHRNQNVVLLGPPGVGKTHLAVSLAVASCQYGFTAYFLTIQDLISDLKKADSIGRLKSKLKSLAKPKVLILDEMGYLPLNIEESNLFFQLVCARYERGSIVITSNKSYGAWNEVFPDTTIAAAILDRLLHHSVTLNIKGDSYRLKDKKKVGLFDSLSATSNEKGGA